MSERGNPALVFWTGCWLYYYGASNWQMALLQQ